MRKPKWEPPFATTSGLRGRERARFAAIRRRREAIESGACLRGRSGRVLTKKPAAEAAGFKARKT